MAILALRLKSHLERKILSFDDQRLLMCKVIEMLSLLHQSVVSAREGLVSDSWLVLESFLGVEHAADLRARRRNHAQTGQVEANPIVILRCLA